MSVFSLLRNLALREKFVAVVSLVIVVSMLIISGYLIKRQNEIYHQELEKRGRALAANLAYNAEYGVILESKEELENLIKGVALSDDIVYVKIVASDGRVLAEIGRNLTEKAALVPNQSDAEQSDSALFSHYLYRSEAGDDFIELRHQVRTMRKEISKENLGAVAVNHTSGSVYEKIGEVRIGLTLANLNREVSKSQTAAILLTLMVVLSAIIIMTAFVRIIVRPIESLAEITDKISKGDLSKTVDITWKDEIGMLAMSFNRMIASLKKSQQEIEDYNRTLEEKIIERTCELEGAQAQLIQSEKMAAIGQLAAGVAHELNNPLGGILGYAQFALEKIENKEIHDLKPKDMESYKRYLRDIETQSRRCKAIVQNLLKFSRTSQTVEFLELDINQVLEETLTFIDHQLMMNQVALRKTIDRNIPKTQGNPGQLQQVFTNIIINAMHASKPGSEIAISTRFLPPLGEFAGAVEVAVADQGTGISEENLKKIFEPFFTTKEVGKGTGLGLSVSYGIIKEHGGEIRVKSRLGQGSIFTIILPLEKKGISVEKQYSA
ncbi:putative signal transduction histidine kinase [Candidatus Zixiibacteriota bacterium]|nr:putative signal transduction histidine kinase [candidate division Zixibacteria bacterium]